MEIILDMHFQDVLPNDVYFVRQLSGLQCLVIFEKKTQAVRSASVNHRVHKMILGKSHKCVST